VWSKYAVIARNARLYIAEFTDVVAQNSELQELNVPTNANTEHRGFNNGKIFSKVSNNLSDVGKIIDNYLDL
jgi:hypothetical protein